MPPNTGLVIFGIDKFDANFGINFGVEFGVKFDVNKAYTVCAMLYRFNPMPNQRLN